jgi:MerR family transcriptional regulator/heat shock protein HspR
MIRPKENQPVYVISVAAELIGCHPRTLRIYEGKGLIHPHRTKNNSRLYSEKDLEQIKIICDLMEHGLNLCGVRAILAIARRLHKDVEEIHRIIDRLDF